MFRAIWSKTLRDYRTPVLAFGIGYALLLIAGFATYGTQISGTAGADSVSQLAQTFRFFGDPVAISTPVGFVTWKYMDLFVPLIPCIWTLFAGSQLTRGDEERGSMDLLLSTPRSRTRLVLEKIAALILALIFMGLLTALGAIAGEASASSAIDVGRALVTGLNISLLTFFFAALALFLSQLLRSRDATNAITGGLLTLAVLLDGMGRSINDGEWLRRFSPFYYYNLNKPLIPTYASDLMGPSLLLALSIVLSAGGIWLFTHRDIGGVALPAWLLNRARTRHKTAAQALAQAQRDITGRSIGLRAAGAQATAIFWWLLAIVCYVAWATLITPNILAPFRKLIGSVPLIQKLFSGHDVGTNASFLAFMVFLLVSILVVVFALSQALKWPGDLDSGRMEVILSTPNSRLRILLERFVAVFVAALLAPLLIWLVVILSTSSIDLNIDNSKVAAASLSILPLELVIITFVYALAERVRGGIILGVVSAYLVLAYLGEMLKTALNLPEWTLSLSIFHAYGNPILEGWRWGPSALLLAVAALFLIIGTLQFSRADIQRGA